jgi:macrolide transport system ATP-binding/permease protein
MFEVKNLTFSYAVDQKEVQVLKSLNFKVKPGEFVGIQGPSGSGKSTLFYILGFLLKPTTGQVLFDGQDITQLSSDELTIIRNQKIGFIFQQFHLLAKTSTLDNILLPTKYPSEVAQPGPETRAKAIALAEQLGLKDHLGHFPNQLSGGQQQRVAIARALMNDVDLILADEPTGNLDSVNARQILELLSELCRQGKTIILITHDSEVAKHCSKVYHLKDGAFTRIEENHPLAGSAEGLNLREIESHPIRLKLPKKYSFSLYRRVAASVMPLVTQNLLRNKSKSILTMLGVVIGVAAVLAMVTLGQYTKTKILETYEALGVNKLQLRGYPNWNMKATDQVAVSFRSFEWDKDFLPLQRIFPEIRYMSPVLEGWQNSASSGGLSVSDNVTAVGVSEQYLAISNRVVTAGRGLSPYHIQNRSPVCVLGFDIAQRLFAHINPVGQIVTVSNRGSVNFPCQVIGVLGSVSSNKDWSPPNLHIILPYTYYQTVADSWNAQIHAAALQISSSGDVVTTGKKIKSFFEVKYGKSGQFMVDTDSTLVAQMKRFLSLFTVLLTVIALLSLVVGGIGINNMMLVSVTERIKEFGIRKALGATNQSIRIQVLMESVLLCVVAGIIGVILGFSVYELMIFGATQFVANLKFEWIFDPVAMVLSVVSILVVGIASGLIPAIRAEKLEVIEALRAE